MWVGATRRESTREGIAESFSRKKIKVRAVMGRGGEEPAIMCDPGSELRLGGSKTRRAKTINGIGKSYTGIL